VLWLIGKRLLYSLPLIFIVSTLSFVLQSLVHGDIARTILGIRGTPEQYRSLRESLGLDEAAPVRYWHWLQGALHGDLGTSLFTQQSVAGLLNSRLPVTLSLVVGATLASAVIGIALGVASALRPGSVDTLMGGVGLVGLATPDFFLGLVLVTWLAVDLHLFPATGYVSPQQSAGQWLQSIALPVTVLTVGAVAVIARQTRESMRDVLERPFIKTLRAAGVRDRSVIFKHALRNAAIPVVTVLGLTFVGILSGTVVVESVFSIPGLGGTGVQATEQHDAPLVQGVVLYFTVIIVLVNLLIDLLYGWLDPRVRVS
jgi:peptide/nickel transport system permease protein